MYSRRDYPERPYQNTNNNREDGELVDSDDEKEDGEVSSHFKFRHIYIYIYILITLFIEFLSKVRNTHSD